MGGKTTIQNDSHQATTAAPPSWTMPGISDAAARVTAALQNLPGDKYTGNFVAAPDYTKALAAYSASAGKSADLSNWMQAQTQGYKPVGANFTTDLSGTQTGQAGLDGAISSAIAPVQRALMEQTLPSLRNSALESGAYSNDRAIATLPEQAIRDSVNSQQQIAATLGYQNLQDNANRALQAYAADTARGLGVGQLGADQQEKYMAALPDLIDTIMRTSTAGGDIQTNMANLLQTQQQAGINNDMAKNQYGWQYPFQGLDIASSLLAQLSGNYGTTTSDGHSTQTQTTGGLGSVLQGALGLAGLAGSFAMPGGGNLMSSLFRGGGGPAQASTSLLHDAGH